MNMINLTVNGKPTSASAEPRTHLADFLREIHNYTGTHIGCEHGVCGACTLLVDGVPTRSCITFAAACDQAEVTTIEGLDNDEIAKELRAAFSQEHGLQCGYCTPGMMVSARDVVLRMEAPSEHEIRVLMSGNLCRCTGYVGIIRAIAGVIEARRARGVAAVPGGYRTVLGPAGCGHAPLSSFEAPKPKTAAARVAAQPSDKQAGAEPKLDADWKPQMTFGQSFTVSHPPEIVWDFFGRIGEVAACLPGASLVGHPVDGHVEGRIKVKVGPISAEFQGVADVSRDDAARTGQIAGAGRDQRSNSATRGLIGYAVKPAANAGETLVDVTIGYTLTGMLAQFGRSGLVQDVANRIIDTFVKNLEAGLSGKGDAVAAATEFDAGSLMSAVIFGRIKRIFGFFMQRRPAIEDPGGPYVAAVLGPHGLPLSTLDIDETRKAEKPAPKFATQHADKPAHADLKSDTAWKPQMTFGQSFIVSHPPEIVWDFFGRIGEVASCLPGAALAGEPVNGHVEGRIKVKVGPISAEFQGVADVTRDDTSRTGQISGAGRDQRSNSATRGLIGYVLKPGANAGETQVDVTIGYTLTGMLAQFGRSGLVQDVANRIIEAFATNLEAKLSGEGENATVANEFDAGSLMSSVILGRIKKIFGGLFGKRRKPGSP